MIIKKIIIKNLIISLLFFNMVTKANDITSMSGISEAAGSSAQAAADQLASDAGKVAGSKVTEGEIKNKCKARLIRDGIVVYDGEITSIFREKNAVKEVKNGLECGISFKDLINFKSLTFLCILSLVFSSQGNCKKKSFNNDIIYLNYLLFL